MQDIIIENLCKAYGKKTVLQNFSCRFPAGQISCLMAPSGWGKTTLLRILMGLEALDSGRISGAEGLRISPLFQEDRLCENLSAIANLRLVNPKLSPEEAHAALKDAGLGESAKQRIQEFSGGMKRRAALMRSLCTPGDLLILDEPFKGLDSATRLQMIRCVSSRRNGRTLILVSHDPADAKDLQAQLIDMTRI